MSALESELKNFHKKYIPILHKHSPIYKKFDKNQTRNIHEMIYVTGQNFVDQRKRYRINNNRRPYILGDSCNMHRKEFIQFDRYFNNEILFDPYLKMEFPELDNEICFSSPEKYSVRNESIQIPKRRFVKKSTKNLSEKDQEIVEKLKMKNSDNKLTSKTKTMIQPSALKKQKLSRVSFYENSYETYQFSRAVIALRSISHTMF